MIIQGADDLQKKLSRLSGAAIGKALATSAKAGALKIENAAKKKVPVRTGTLKRSIHSEITSQTDTSIVVTTGPATPYARVIEFGSDEKGQHRKAKPYLRPAFDEQVDTARDTIKASFKKIIDKATT